MKEKDPSMEEWKHEYVSRMMIDYMMKENKDLADAFANRFEDWEEKKEFIKDLIDGNKNVKVDEARYYMYEEEYNLYELFHTRIGLFRRAYFHKATKAVELMFTDALVKSNDHLDFRNKKGEKIKMSTAWKHPDVYEKLTDNVFEAILMKDNPDEEMQQAQELINNVYKRKLYKLVDETLPVEKIKTEDKRSKQLLLKTELTDDDFAVQKVNYSYGKGPDNPITSVYFYSKDNDTDCFPKTKSKKTSLFLPDIFQEEVLRIYSKNSTRINLLTKETTKCLKKVGLDSVNNSAIELKNAAPKKATKHKMSSEGKSGPSTRSSKKKRKD